MFGQFVFRQGTHQHSEYVVAPRKGRVQRVPATHHAWNRGQHINLYAALKARVQVHERPIKERIALAKHDDVMIAGQVGKTVRPVGVESDHQFAVFVRPKVQFGGDGVFHRIFGHVVAQQAIDDGAGLSSAALLAKICNVVRAANDTV